MRRRACASNPPLSAFMRHRVRRKVEAWRSIGASGHHLDWIRHGVRIPWRLRPPPAFNRGISLLDATPEQVAFVERELERFIVNGAFEKTLGSNWVSRMFLVPKGIGKWRIIIDLRPINEYCQTRSMKFETLNNVKHLARPNDWMLSLDLMDGYYAVGIAEEDRKYFTVNIRGQHYRLAGLPMGWSLSPYYFCSLMDVAVRHLRSPMFAHQPASAKVSRRRLRGNRGIRMLPFVDDWGFFLESRQHALRARPKITALLEDLGLARNPSKGEWEPTQAMQHLGLIIDTKAGEFRAPEEKLQKIAVEAKNLILQSVHRRRWVPAKRLAALAGKAQFLYLAIPAARFYLRELHTVLSTKSSWQGKVRVTKQLHRDLEWWTSVPSQQNGRPIWRAVETAYIHVDSSDFGWGAVLDDHHQARGFWGLQDRNQHITFKELKAVRYAVESFLPHIVGRNVLLHEDNQAVVAVLTHLTTRSPDMMLELRKLWFLLDTHGIHIRPRYIRSAANIWADSLSRELDSSDWSVAPKVFRYLDRIWGPHSVDRFASMENALLARYNSKWKDPDCEAVDSLHLSDSCWARDVNWCYPPWQLLDELVVKLRRSGAAATVIAPLWPGSSWHQQLVELAEEVITYPPSHDLFYPSRRSVHEGAVLPRWSMAAFKVPCQVGPTSVRLKC